MRSVKDLNTQFQVSLFLSRCADAQSKSQRELTLFMMVVDDEAGWSKPVRKYNSEKTPL